MLLFENLLEGTNFYCLLLSIVVVLNLASLLASLRLNKIINYVELYKISKTFLGCPTQPILHRSAVFQLIESNTREDTELFDEIFQDGKDLSNFINRPDSSGRTPLYNACERQSTKKVLQLLSAGAKINQTTANGWTALHIACEKQSLRKVQQLLEAGANINTTTDLGRTPLHIACDKKSAEISLELLNGGAVILSDKKHKGPKLAWLGLGPWRRGIQHVVESPDLLKLLRTWSSADENLKEKAEQGVNDMFDKDTKVLTIPLTFAIGREGIMEIARNWNNNHSNKCEYY